MYGEGDPLDPNVMYYLTVYNENISQPAEPKDVDVEGILRGMHCISRAEAATKQPLQLLASGIAVPWALEAKRLLAEDWGLDSAVWSVTSWQQLRTDGNEVMRHNFLHPQKTKQREAYVTSRLAGSGPVIATSDYDRMLPDLIREWVPAPYYTLGADGFGYSDTRRAARRYFLIDSHSMVVRALQAAAGAKMTAATNVAKAIKQYDLENPNAGTSEQ